MSLVSPSQSNAGDVITANAINGPVNQIAAVLNGGIDATNITDGSITTAKLSSSLGSALSGGYQVLSATPNTVTYNGNRSYTCTFNSVDLTATLSPGFRFRTTRTVAAPTQSTSLNGTTQYWSKVAPAGMTFTDNFTVSAWVKLTSYAVGGVISRYDGTNGWYMLINASGQINMAAFGAATNRSFNSYQSVPLNKWVHVASTLTMATGTCNMYIDGVLVPNSAVGAAGTSLTQAGNLNVGAFNSINFFPGKIAQAAVFSTVLSAATIQSYYSQGLAGTETSLISAYSFNGTANDLNTTNANNLTANGSVTATAADSPFGGQGNGSISSTLDYGIVQSASFATNTTVVVQVAEGCTLPTSGGVSAIAYSSVKVPYGFPSQSGKWTIETLIFTEGAQASPAANTWYNLSSVQLAIPVGEWRTSFQAAAGSDAAAAGRRDVKVALSTSATTPNDVVFAAVGMGQGSTFLGWSLYRERQLSVQTITNYFLITSTTQPSITTLFLFGRSTDEAPVVVGAVNAYL